MAKSLRPARCDWRPAYQPGWAPLWNCRSQVRLQSKTSSFVHSARRRAHMSRDGRLWTRDGWKWQAFSLNFQLIEIKGHSLGAQLLGRAKTGALRCPRAQNQSWQIIKSPLDNLAFPVLSLYGKNYDYDGAKVRATELFWLFCAWRHLMKLKAIKFPVHHTTLKKLKLLISLIEAFKLMYPHQLPFFSLVPK